MYTPDHGSDEEWPQLITVFLHGPCPLGLPELPLGLPELPLGLPELLTVAHVSLPLCPPHIRRGSKASNKEGLAGTMIMRS